MSRAAGPDGFVSSAVWPTRSAAAYSVRLRMAAVSTGCGKAASASRTSAPSRVPSQVMERRPDVDVRFVAVAALHPWAREGCRGGRDCGGQGLQRGVDGGIAGAELRLTHVKELEILLEDKEVFRAVVARPISSAVALQCGSRCWARTCGSRSPATRARRIPGEMSRKRVGVRI